MITILKEQNQIKKIIYYLALFIIIINFLIFKALTTDEIEHLHFSYLTGHGLSPFVDYWQHHMPGIWYLFAFIKFIPSFFGKILSVRIVQSIFWVITAYFLDLSFSRKNSIIITLILICSFPIIDFFSFRPEFFCLPLMSYVLYLINSKKIFRKLPLIFLLFSLAVFLSPRIYFFIFPVFLYILYKVQLLKVVKSILPATIAFSILLFLFNFRDLYFFVFNIDWSCQTDKILSLSLEDGLFWYTILIFNILFFFISIYDRKWLVVSIYLMFGLALFLEKAPFINQSTILMNFLSIYVGLTFINNFNKIKVTLPITILSFIFIINITYLKNRKMHLLNYNFITNELPVYINSTKKFKNNYVQGNGYYSMQTITNNLTHPIFILDGSYFGFYQHCILDNSYMKIIDYNFLHLRNIDYFKKDKITIFSNEKNKFFYSKIEDYTKQKSYDNN